MDCEKNLKAIVIPRNEKPKLVLNSFWSERNDYDTMPPSNFEVGYRVSIWQKVKNIRLVSASRMNTCEESKYSNIS